MKLRHPSKKRVKEISNISFWFFIGAFIAAFLISGFAFIIFQTNYKNLVYPGVSINGVDFSKKSQSQVEDYFINKNRSINTLFVFNYKELSATVSAVDINYGYDSQLLAKQAISIGRSPDVVSNLSIIFQSYISGINLNPTYSFSKNTLEKNLSQIAHSINSDPVDALFSFENGRVTAFRPSSDGKQIDYQTIEEELSSKAPLVASKNIAIVSIPVSVKKIPPKISTDKANNLGIKELIGVGTSLFQHSIPERVFNVTLAASRVNGSLIAPGEIFSFDKALGDVSSFTGYKQAYVIQNGHTVLGDGGGVCQVSTTFFRAILDAGMPIEERTAHAYRVGYYEEDSPPGIDATVYVPSVDLKFKNDTKNYILVQTVVDPSILRLTVYLYGTKDGREVSISKPVITGQTAPPAPLYQDDPTLPSGTIKQVDFEAWGANVYFTRTVSKDGKTIISDKFTSNYRPWQAVFLRGTK